jgi:uncharacterized protein YigE (DUF2233 family)
MIGDEYGDVVLRNVNRLDQRELTAYSGHRIVFRKDEWSKMIRAGLLILILMWAVSAAATTSSRRFAAQAGRADGPMARARVTAARVAYQTADIDLQKANLKLYWKKADGTLYATLAAVQKALGATFLFATNSGIYSTDFKPLGLEIERGKTLVPLNKSHASTGNFYMQPNGVFFITGKGAQVMETSEYAAVRPAGVLEAAQSGPLLLRKGVINGKFASDSASVKIRSGVGVNSAGHVVFALSEDRVDFYDFAVFFRDHLHCPDALYLDGTISTFLDADGFDSIQLAVFAGIWAASAKP